MEQRPLGKSGITTTAMGIGTLTMSPLQRGLGTAEGGQVILAALTAGVRLIDTAQMYGSYPQVQWALQRWTGTPVTVITKSAARTAEDMSRALTEALSILGTDRLDGFLLHAIRSAEDFEQRRPAWEVLLRAKEAGVIRGVGISSHFSQAIAFASERSGIDLLHPIFNRDGVGVLDVPIAEHHEILHAAARRGKGIYAMKPLGGGHLRNDVSGALRWLLSRPETHAFVVGMTSDAEILANVAVCSGREVPDEVAARISRQARNLFVNKAICTGCGNCERTCDHGAIQLSAGKAVTDPSRCVLCGYCAPTCPTFAIRVI